MELLSAHAAAGLEVGRVATTLRTSLSSGLSSQEACLRRCAYGHNEFEIQQEDPLWKKYLGQVCPFVCLICCHPVNKVCTSYCGKHELPRAQSIVSQLWKNTHFSKCQMFVPPQNVVFVNHPSGHWLQTLRFQFPSEADGIL